MNLSLDADLLPKTHAGGGEADIVWKYGETPDFPQHDLLIEATLADAGNQRRMEMEPVSRHLGEYLLANPNFETYCVFLTNYLNLNVISDFRMRKNQPYYARVGENFVEGMMIIPLETDTLIELLERKTRYSHLYKIFHNFHNDNSAPKEWQAKLVEKLRGER